VQEMVYTRFVEVGRLVLLNYGPDHGKVAFILDVIDQNRVLIEGPTTGVKRQALNFKRLNLTDFKLKIPRSGSAASIKKALAKDDVIAKWNATAWAKKLEGHNIRANLSDFDRFKLMILRKKKRSVIGKEYTKLKKEKNTFFFPSKEYVSIILSFFLFRKTTFEFVILDMAAPIAEVPQITPSVQCALTVYIISVPLRRIRTDGGKLHRGNLRAIIQNNTVFNAVPLNQPYVLDIANNLYVLLIKRAEDDNEVFQEIPEIEATQLRRNFRVFMFNSTGSTVKIRTKFDEGAQWDYGSMDVYRGIISARFIDFTEIEDH